MQTAPPTNPSPGEARAPAREPNQAARSLANARDLPRALVNHVFAQLPTSLVFNAGGAIIFVVACYSRDHGVGMLVWCLAHLLATLFQLGILRHFTANRALRGDTRRARAARRIGALLTGMAWGLGGVFWSLSPGAGPGFVLCFCYAGIAAGATMTLAGDPLAYAILVYCALLPAVLRGWSDGLWWSSALLVWFAVGTSFVVLRNSKALRESLNLRFENVELLERTLAAHQSAVEARGLAERTAAATTRFLAAASHDLRQPVQALSLFADVLSGLPAQQAAQRERLVDAIARSTTALRVTLEGLLDLSRFDAGITCSSPRAVALEPLLDEVSAGLRDECDERGVVLYVRGHAGTVVADPSLLARVLHNLAANAVRHAGQGRVLIAVRRRGTACAIQVWDQGPGIAESDRERIFEEFVQVGNPERDRSRGLGLGLPIVRRICALHGWPIAMRTRLGHGSMFSVTVPLAEPRAATPGARAQPEAATGFLSPNEPVAASSRSRLQVMLVEDDALVREAAKGWLESRDCDVQVASNGHDALATLARMGHEGREADVLITDQRLPGNISGSGLIALARQASRRQLQAVLLTGDSEVTLPGEARGLVVLRKPVDGETLWAAFGRTLSSGRPSS